MHARAVCGAHRHKESAHTPAGSGSIWPPPGWLPMGDPDWLSMGDPEWRCFPDPSGSA